MTTPLISLEQVTFSYAPQNHIILDQLSLQIEKGSVTAILGPNGAGKTTLLHTLLGWLRPQSGRVLLDGKPLGKYSRREIGQWIGLVPQMEHIPYDYTVLEYVLFGRTPYLDTLEIPSAEDLVFAAQALEQVGLTPLTSRPVTQLSGGERQLVLVARALAQQPRILLLDEPTAHLDLANKHRLIELLRELKTQGATILLTTHDPEVASAFASHVILMGHRQALQVGPLEEVFTSQNLSSAYGLPVEVVQIRDRRVVLWI